MLSQIIFELFARGLACGNRKKNLGQFLTRTGEPKTVEPQKNNRSTGTNALVSIYKSVRLTQMETVSRRTFNEIALGILGAILGGVKSRFKSAFIAYAVRTAKLFDVVVMKF